MFQYRKQARKHQPSYQQQRKHEEVKQQAESTFRQGFDLVNHVTGHFVTRFLLKYLSLLNDVTGSLCCPLNSFTYILTFS
jgi:hypothetical protein